MKLSRKTVLFVAALIASPILLVSIAAAASVGKVVGRAAMTQEEALHWGMFPRGVIPTRDYEIRVKRLIDGKVVDLCVSYECYHSSELGDYYFGQY